MKKTKILLTGSMGFIGSHLAKLLDNNQDIEYVGYDIKNGDDILDKRKLDKLFATENFDIVVHLAALAGVGQGETFYEDYINTNVIGTKILIDCCKKYNVNKFILYSSSSVLGGITTSLEAEEGLHESCDYNPKGIYGLSKMSAEILLKQSSIDYLILRPFTVYGDNGRKDLVFYKWINLIRQNKPIIFYGEGNTRRGYTFVGDLTKATLDCIIELMKEDNIFKLENKRILHIGGSEVITLKEVYEIFLEYCSTKKIFIDAKKIPVQNFDIEASFANISLAKKLIGYNPKPKFKEHLLEILKEEIK